MRYAPPAAAEPSSQANASPLAHDERYFAATGFRIDDDAIWSFAQQLDAGPAVLGQPLSRTFTLWGCHVQIFELRVVQACPGVDVTLPNVLDSDIFPIRHVDGGVLPAIDQGLTAQAPKPDSPEYLDVAAFVRAHVPDTFDGLNVGFQQAYFAIAATDVQSVNLWGAPLAAP